MQKVYRNPSRQEAKQERKPYIPQYVVRGIEPTESTLLARNGEVEENVENFVSIDGSMISSAEDYKESIIDDLDGPLPSFQNFDEYVLLLEGKLHFKGSSAEMNEYVSALVFGEHPDFPEPLSPDDLIVLKRVQVKVGVFLE